MEMGGVEQTATGAPAALPPVNPQQVYQHHLKQKPEQQQQVVEPSPAVLPEVEPPPSPNAAVAPQPSNGVAPGAQLGQSAAASPATRPGTPLSHPSHPSTPKGFNGLPSMLPLSQIADASLNAIRNSAAPAAAPAAVNAGPSTSTNNHVSRAKEALRWRDPITVQYDTGGQPQPAKVHVQHSAPTTANASTLPPSAPTQQQQQVSLPPLSASQAHQYPHAQQLHHQQPPPPGQLHQNHQQNHQHNADPLPSLAHQHNAHHSLPVPVPLSQHHQHYTLPPSSHQHQQQQHHTPPASAHRQPLPFSPQLPAPSLPHPPPAATLPPLHHHGAPPASSQPLPPARAIAIHAGSITNKPVIMDPPVRRADQAQAAAARNAGFASPTPDYARINPKFNDDVQRMVFAVQQSIPEAVRRVIRDNWEKCLLGSEFHQAFILNASIHHALPSITRRAVRDFGHKMVGESKEELIEHFSTADLDSVADKIIAKASDSFLDKCLEKRLLTIEAKPLINALARAERLGYEPNDMVQEDHHERVIPQEAYPGATNTTATAYPQRPQSLSNTSVQTLRCPNCYRGFQYKPAHDYHVIHNVCTVQPPTSEGFTHACQACGQGFTMADEVQAHIDSRVCGGYPSKSSARGPGRPARGPIPTPPSNPVNIAPSVQTPTPNGYQMTQVQAQATPTPLNSAPRRAASVATPSGSPNPHDPYAHLAPEDLAKMNAELAEAEAKYAPRFKEAESIADDNGRRTRIEGLRNSFGTKQSMIRKKYGVRLRERRTKAEIQAEKERLGIKRLERAERERARAAIITSGGIIGSSSLVNVEPSVRPVGSSGWVAANTPRPSGVGVWEEHDAKRRRVDEVGGFHTPYKHGADETPTRKVLSVDQMGGGLSAATATAAAHDPTGSPPSRSPKVSGEAGTVTRAQKPQAPIDLTSASPTPSSTPNGEDHQETAAAQQPQPPVTKSSAALPVAADDSSDDDEDDEDIPSTLPPQIQRQSLTPHKGGATVMS